MILNEITKNNETMTDVVGEFDENRIAHQHCGIGTQPYIENVILVHITSSPERKLSIAYCLETEN